jgi:hypothetical protein
VGRVEGDVWRLRLEELRLGPNVTSGMNYMLVGVLSYKLRTSLDDLPPIEVKRVGDCFQVVDGRHRVVAHMIAGRPDILACP